MPSSRVIGVFASVSEQPGEAVTELGEVELAWIAADRGLSAARLTGDPVVTGSLFRSVAHALLAIHGPTAPVHAAHLAHHFEEAGESLEAARWHEQAGRRGARNDPADGVRHCRKVTTLLAAIPESRETLVLQLTSRIALLEIGRLAGIEERESQLLFEEAQAVEAPSEEPVAEEPPAEEEETAEKEEGE